MLPQPATQEECDALDRTAEVFATAIRQGFADHVGALPIKATAVGSYPVFHVGSHYIAKLFSPLDRDLFRTEHAALRALGDSPDVPAPELVATKEIEGWNAVLMTRLTGESLAEIWPLIDASEKQAMCETLGRIARALHRLDPSPLTPSSLDWDTFVEAQLRDCASRQRRLGLSEALAREIPAFLGSLPLREHDARSILHTELMLDHVFAARVDGELQITGLLDFEPAMVGAPEYELASVGLFVARGESHLLRAFMAGYGQAIDPEFHRRVMGFTLLHRYSKLSWYLEFMPRGDSIEELAKKWFAAS